MPAFPTLGISIRPTCWPEEGPKSFFVTLFQQQKLINTPRQFFESGRGEGDIFSKQTPCLWIGAQFKLFPHNVFLYLCYLAYAIDLALVKHGTISQENPNGTEATFTHTSNNLADKVSKSESLTGRRSAKRKEQKDQVWRQSSWVGVVLRYGERGRKVCSIP